MNTHQVLFHHDSMSWQHHTPVVQEFKPNEIKSNDNNTNNNKKKMQEQTVSLKIMSAPISKPTHHEILEYELSSDHEEEEQEQVEMEEEEQQEENEEENDNDDERLNNIEKLQSTFAFVKDKWRYSKPRKLAFWIRGSIQDLSSPVKYFNETNQKNKLNQYHDITDENENHCLTQSQHNFNSKNHTTNHKHSQNDSYDDDYDNELEMYNQNIDDAMFGLYHIHNDPHGLMNGQQLSSLYNSRPFLNSTNNNDDDDDDEEEEEEEEEEEATPRNEYYNNDDEHSFFEYDWLLDGDPIDDDTNTSTIQYDSDCSSMYSPNHGYYCTAIETHDNSNDHFLSQQEQQQQQQYQPMHFQKSKSNKKLPFGLQSLDTALNDMELECSSSITPQASFQSFPYCTDNMQNLNNTGSTQQQQEQQQHHNTETFIKNNTNKSHDKNLNECNIDSQSKINDPATSDNSDIADFNDILLLLELGSDTTTLEGRFSRRLQQDLLLRREQKDFHLGNCDFHEVDDDHFHHHDYSTHNENDTRDCSHDSSSKRPHFKSNRYDYNESIFIEDMDPLVQHYINALLPYNTLTDDDEDYKEGCKSSNDHEEDLWTSSASCPDFIYDTLLSLPWHVIEDCLNGIEQDDLMSIQEIDSNITHKLSHLDEVSTNVGKLLYQQIQSKEDDINIGMKRIQDVDLHITSALSFAKQANLYLERARGGGHGINVENRNDAVEDNTLHCVGLLDSEQIIKDDDQRSKLLQLDDTLKNCHEVIEMERCIQDYFIAFVDCYGNPNTSDCMDPMKNRLGEIHTWIENCMALKIRIEQDEQLQRLKCLESFRNRVSHMMDYVCSKIDDAMTHFIFRRCSAVTHLQYACDSMEKGSHSSTYLADNMSQPSISSWDAESRNEYSSLINARVLLHERHVEESKQNLSILDGDISSSPSLQPQIEQKLPNIGALWSKSILKSLGYEFDRSLARSLLYPTPNSAIQIDDNSSTNDGMFDFDKNLLEIGIKVQQIQSYHDDAASIRTLIQNLLVIRFDFQSHEKHLPFVYHKLCVHLAHVLHIYYNICQYHIQHQCSSNKSEDLDCSVHPHSSYDFDNKCVEQVIDSSEYKTPTAITFRSSGSNASPESKSSVISNPTSLPSPSRKTFNNDEVLSIPQCITTSSTNGLDIPIDKSSIDINCPSLQDLNVDDDILLDISNEILKSKTELWKHCESVIVKFLDLAYNLSMKKTVKNESSNDPRSHSTAEHNWKIDLEGLHDILHLSSQMVRFASEFLGHDLTLERQSHSIKPIRIMDKVQDICRKYMRTIHVNAMTEMGDALAKEHWGQQTSEYLQSQNNPNSKMNDIKCTLDLLDQFTLKSSSAVGSRIHDSMNKRTWENMFFYKSKDVCFLPTFSTTGNPFLSCHVDQDTTSKSNPLEIQPDDHASQFYNTLTSLLELTKIPNFIQANTALFNLAKWTSRLHEILNKLPIVGTEISNVLENIYDLFLLTIFRLCMGDKINEAIVLGIQNRSDTTFQDNLLETPPVRRDSPNHLRQSSGDITYPTSNSALRRGSSFGKSPSLTSLNNENNLPSNGNKERSKGSLKYVEADICSPRLLDEREITKVREFVLHGQRILSGMVDFDKVDIWTNMKQTNNGRSSSGPESLYFSLHKQILSTLSCLIAAMIYDVESRRMMKSTWHSKSVVDYMHSNYGEDFKLNQSKIGSFGKSMIDMSVHMHHICMRMSCLRAINGKNVVNQILSLDGWAESRIKEHCNEYVDTLSERCISVYQKMLQASPNNDGTSIQKKSLNQTTLFQNIWNHIVENAYLSLLEGFSRIYECSTEGRALMSIDLASLASNLGNVSWCKGHGGNVNVLVTDEGDRGGHYFGMQYVDMYVKVFYFPQEDILKWIQENRSYYHLSHLITLITCGGRNNPENDVGSIMMLRDKVKCLYIG